MSETDEESGDGAPTQHGVRIIGAPLSGTNITRYLVTRYLKIDNIFNRGFWKHGVFPALVDDQGLSHGGLPVIVVSRDPVAQIYAWYQLAKSGMLMLGAVKNGAAHFAQSPITLHLVNYAPRRMSYYFPSPIAYWNQYYFAPIALRHSGAPILFIRHEDILAQPGRTLRRIATFLGAEPEFDDADVVLPAERLRRSDDTDADLTPEGLIRKGVPFDGELAGLDAAVAGLGESASRAIVEAVLPEVLFVTGRLDYPARVEAAIKRQP